MQATWQTTTHLLHPLQHPVQQRQPCLCQLLQLQGVGVGLLDPPQQLEQPPPAAAPDAAAAPLGLLLLLLAAPALAAVVLLLVAAAAAAVLVWACRVVLLSRPWGVHQMQSL